MQDNTPRLLIISHDVVGRQMAGPGIRCYEFSTALSEFCDVTLAIPNRIDIETEGFKARKYNPDNWQTLGRLCENADIILIQGHILYHFPFLKNFKGRIIVDLYNPFNLESLEMFKDREIAERIRIDKNNVNMLKLQLSIGDYFICASEKQRDYWLGMLNGMGRINPYTYDKDNTLRKLIDVVPFGIRSEPPKHNQESTIRDVVPNIKEDDKIALWGGGIWNWLDPITAIKAMWEISRHRKDIKLIFIGTKHPDPKLPEMNKAVEALQLSKELELYNEYIFFNEWTPYDIRQNFLLEADVGLSIHQNRIETQYSYRTRVLDYIWARLPVVTTEGDSIAKMVKSYNIGEVVRYENAQNLARVIESMVTNNSLREIYMKNMNKIAPTYAWENVTRPLVKYCLEGDYASDKKEIMALIDEQNSKTANILKENFGGSTNILALTSDKYEDKKFLSSDEFGKVFFIEVDDGLKGQEKTQDIIGTLKSKISSRTKFDGIIVNNAFEEIDSKFFYDLVNILNSKLKSEGLFFISIPEQRGLATFFKKRTTPDFTKNEIDEFMVEYILKNSDFEILKKGSLKKVEGERGGKRFDEIYGNNELFELFPIKMSDQGFKNLKLLSGFDMLESEELKKDNSIKGKLRKYMYTLTSIYFENLRKSFNESMKSLNNNMHLQINREMNEINRKNRERMLLIYFNLFKSLQLEINKLGCDIDELKEMCLDREKKKSPQEEKLDQRFEALLKDFENIDKIMGLSVSNRYFLARKI